VHFNAAADIDGQGGRLSLLAFPVIRREERCLARVFGEAYEAYAERVRRWW
jgi:protein-S-isoprenylcysteine O-methyltransferase Ste14